MEHLKISDSKDCFTLNGREFFYLADTVWSAFTNPSREEWEEYLDYRRLQNFNVLQINILPQWDRSGWDLPLEIAPFAVKQDGTYDFYSPKEEYFAKAQKMLDMAVERDFRIALVVLWCDFVKGTWASDLMPEHMMPLDAVEPYVRYVLEKFSRYDPVYLVSGDTDFPSEETNRYYRIALETIKRLCPGAITTMHPAGKLAELPGEFENSRDLDFYMYQSAHFAEDQHMPREMAEVFCQKAVRRPVLNGEPCYEGHGYGRRYGRFNAFDIRKATWQSLLSGAKAGIAYGAHGVWSWHRKGMNFANEAFSSKPYEWREALRFRGAWDVSFAKYIFETYRLFDLIPGDIVRNDTKEIRFAMSADAGKFAMYAPYQADIAVNMDLSGYDLTLVNLEDRIFARPAADCEPGGSILRMKEFNSDVLVIGIRRA